MFNIRDRNLMRSPAGTSRTRTSISQGWPSTTTGDSSAIVTSAFTFPDPRFDLSRPELANWLEQPVEHQQKQTERDTTRGHHSVHEGKLHCNFVLL
jgi:hypothetical protein